MKSSKHLTKRAFSPIIQKNTDTLEKKKKSTSNFHQISYKQKEFEPYGRVEKKTSNYLKDILKQPESVNKYRIVTEPVDDRVMTIVSSSFVPSKYRGKLEQQLSGQKIRQTSLPKGESACPHCHRYEEQIMHMKAELTRIIAQKTLWKSGQMNMESVKAAWKLGSSKLKGKQTQLRTFDNVLLDIKKNFQDLMHDIESLTEIDYPKMLALKIFKYNPPIENTKNTQQIEIKSLLGQLRHHYQGKITAWDVEEQSEESDHIKAILRNLRARLSHYLRENLELKVKKVVLEKAEQISNESEDYLRLIIEDVLRAYSSKM